jgi:hypothetical protein
MSIFKCTAGFVIQEFTEDGILIDQVFHAGDQSEWEDANGDILEEQDYPFYAPFTMLVENRNG